MESYGGVSLKTNRWESHEKRMEINEKTENPE